MPFAATWMDGETVRLSKIRQKKTIMMISLICGILKNGTNEFIYKTEIESQMQKTNLWLPRVKGSGGNKLEDWD